MKTYIEVEKALEIVKRTSGDYATAYCEIAHEKPADVMPVVHGTWEFPIFVGASINDRRCKCSECGSIETPLVRHKYCPNCGARMR